MILKICLFVITFILIAYVLGAVWVKDQENKVVSAIVIGIIEKFAVFQIFAVPCSFLNTSLTLCVVLYGISIGILSLISIVVLKGDLFRPLKKIKKMTVLSMLTISLILLQTGILTLGQHIDDDDAWYVGEAVTTLQTDRMAGYDAYTGEKHEGISSRYILSPFPKYNACLSKVSGIHPAVMAHTVFPMLFIPMAYFVYMMLSCVFFPEKRKDRDLFLFLLAVFHMFSYYSAFPASVFMLVRIWQGKAILASSILPLLFCFCLGLKENKITWKYIVVFEMAMLAGIMVSSMGVILGAILAGCAGITYLIVEKKWKKTVLLAIGCLPNILFSIVYLLL